MFIPGWFIFTALVIGGLVLGFFVGEPKGDYDMVSSLLTLGIWIITIVGAVAFLLGKYVF